MHKSINFQKAKGKLLQIPKHLPENTSIEGKRILVRMNDIKGLYVVSHGSAKGRGQGAIMKKAIAWIDDEEYKAI